MDIGFAFLGIVGALAIGAVSPGPSFVLVARTAIAVSRRDGLVPAIADAGTVGASDSGY